MTMHSQLTEKHLKTQARRFMRQAILDDPDSTATGLAEWTADALGYADWLDDEGHWIWEVAVEVFEWAAKRASESDADAEQGAGRIGP